MALACGGDELVEGAQPLPFEPADSQNAPDPIELGPFPVGVTTLDLFDDSRLSSDGSARFLRVEIWYPAVQSASEGPFWTYDLQEEADEAIDLGETRDEFMELDTITFESRGIRDADIDERHGPYPLVLFSHGTYSLRFQYTFFTVYAASHGYIVIAFDHANNTLWDLLRDGFDADVVWASATERLDDMTFVMNQMEKLNATEGHFFQEMMDISSVAAAGHSYGGFAAAAAPCQDTRFQLAVMFTPMLGFVDAFECELDAYPVPAMILGGTRDQTIPWRDQYCAYRQISGVSKYLYQLVDGGHFTFSDLCHIDLDGIDFGEAPDPRTDGCSETENAPVDQAQQTINYYATALLNYVLRGSTGSLDYLTERSDPPFDNVDFYQGDGLPDWPDGGCSTE